MIENPMATGDHHGTLVWGIIQKATKTLTSSQPPVHESSGTKPTSLSETVLVSIAVQYIQNIGEHRFPPSTNSKESVAKQFVIAKSIEI